MRCGMFDSLYDAISAYYFIIHLVSTFSVMGLTTLTNLMKNIHDMLEDLDIGEQFSLTF